MGLLEWSYELYCITGKDLSEFMEIVLKLDQLMKATQDSHSVYLEILENFSVELFR